MIRVLSAFAFAAGAFALAGAAPQPAQAQIKCDGPYQIVQGRPISTPYCRDTHLAYVANEYGMRVSGQEMRWNPSEKARVCRAIGHDNRVAEACVGLRPQDGSRRMFP